MKIFKINLIKSLLILIFPLIMLSGCEKYYEELDKKRTEELKCCGELNIISLRIYNEFKYNQKKPDSINRLCQVFKEDGQLSFFESYGLENLYFNQDIELWTHRVDYYNSTNIDFLTDNKDNEIRKLAIALKIEPEKYLGIRFDGTWCKTNTLSPELHNILIEQE
ncbi:MAG: hypothetical protein M0Q48_00540 [Verrucomicrobia bacterium]|nr:hypothetical protein [Verrucomicrobiota bacterium]